jgi:hypothetical protein
MCNIRTQHWGNSNYGNYLDNIQRMVRRRRYRRWRYFSLNLLAILFEMGCLGFYNAL